MAYKENYECAFERAYEIINNTPDNDKAYFENNIHRFMFTLREIVGVSRNGKILDIGCHYLHQAILLSCLNFEVYGIDVSEFLKKKSLKDRAEICNIKLIEVDKLYANNCLWFFESNKFDYILLTELLEHIAFNPINMWKEIHRVLKVGAKIIITTPNYYYLPSQINQIKRLFLLRGGYIPVEDIFKNVTYGHHWKEYSVKEIKRYFSLLSKDFHVEKIILFNPHGYPVETKKRAIFYLMGKLIPAFQKSIYIEVKLKSKNQGVALSNIEY